MKKNLFSIITALMFVPAVFARTVDVSSPDKTIVVQVELADNICYTLSVDGRQVIGKSYIAFTTDLPVKGAVRPINIRRRAVDRNIEPVIREKCKVIRDRYNELRIDFSDGRTLEWRAYNNGVAWRWIVESSEAFCVIDEKTDIRIGEDAFVWYTNETDFYSSNQCIYTRCRTEELAGQSLASLPLLFETAGLKIAVTESNLRSYAGWWLKSSGTDLWSAAFPRYPRQMREDSDRDQVIVTREDFISKHAEGTDFPWRVVMVARDDKSLLTNQLVYQLADASAADFSWVRPGKLAWDWWNDNNVYNVDFRAGVNTETYKYYVDFASKYGIEYVALDEGWYELSDIRKTVPAVDVPQIVDYARSKQVGVILWVTWLRLDRQMEETFELCRKWGVKGLKVDFMQRDDQPMVEFLERVACKAAEYKMVIDFHGGSKSTGLSRTYPNVLNYESVYGLEQAKGDQRKLINPDHDLVLPFTRMLAGPLDYTPGAMDNYHYEAWTPNWKEPSSIGTRCHQLGMYVIFDAPLQMLCDSPTKYMAETRTMEFLSAVPTVWNQTIALEAAIGDYVLIAREDTRGEWYVGGLNDNAEAREFSVSLSFLPQGEYVMKIWRDGVNADRNAKDLAYEEIRVTERSVIPVVMARGGGYAARIIKQ